MLFCGPLILLSALLLLGCASGGDHPYFDHGRIDPLTRSPATPNAVPDGYQNLAIIAFDRAQNAAAARNVVVQATPKSWPTGSGITATSVYAPVEVDGLIRRGINGRPLADTLVETVNALSGDGLPIGSAGKNTDPATLLRVRGDTVMLLWRYPL